MKSQTAFISPGLSRYMSGNSGSTMSWEPTLTSERQAQLFSLNSNIYHGAKGQLFRLIDLLYPSTDTVFVPSRSESNG